MPKRSSSLGTWEFWKLYDPCVAWTWHPRWQGQTRVNAPFTCSLLDANTRNFVASEWNRSIQTWFHWFTAADANSVRTCSCSSSCLKAWIGWWRFRTSQCKKKTEFVTMYPPFSVGTIVLCSVDTAETRIPSSIMAIVGAPTELVITLPYSMEAGNGCGATMASKDP